MADSVQRIPLAEVTDLIEVGAPLPFRVLDGQARLLLSARQVVASASQLESLIERGAWAEGDAVQAERKRRGEGESTPAAGERRETLFDRWEHAIWELDALMRRLAAAEPLDAALREAATRHAALVDREPDVALFMAMRQDDRRFALYPLTHALHTGSLCLFAARQLGWEPERQQRLVLGALTMNASMLELQAAMAEQSAPPTPKQMGLIRSHTERSAAMLAASGVRDTAWLALVRDHHEQPGGGGYPRGIAEVGDDARLLRAADVFMAKISPRALRAPMIPQAAAKQLFQQEKGGPIAGALIKSIGVHPPGGLVQLASGEVGVVAHRAGAGRAAASVATLTDRAGRPVPETHLRDTAQPAYAIKGTAPEGFSVKRVFGERVYGMLEP